MNKQKLLTLLAVLTVFTVLAGMAGAATLTEVIADVIYSENNGNFKAFPMSVYPGKTSYSGTGENGDVSGDFDAIADTAFDYIFVNTNSSNDGFDIVADGGLGRFATPKALEGYAGNENWGVLWTTNDPDTEDANFNPVKTAKAKTVKGTINISGLQSGIVYFLYGGYRGDINIDITLSGSGLADVTLVDAGAIFCNNNEMILTGIEFTNDEGYDTLTYETSCSDASAGRSRFMGAVIEGLSANNPEVIYPAHGEIVAPGAVPLQWINLDPNGASETYVDVWFGTDPNKVDGEANGTYTKIVNGESVSSVTITPPGPGVYYWQIDSYTFGKPTTAGGTVDYSSGDPCMLESPVYTFTNDAPIESVSAGADMITWSGEPVTLTADVSDDGGSALTYAWTMDDTPAGVTAVFDPSGDVAAPSITVTTAPYSDAGIINAGFEADQQDEDGWGGSPGWTQLGRMGNWNPPADAYTNSEVPEGVMCAWAQHNDGGLAQVLTETLAVDTQYELTVEVGNSNRYDWTGYKVQLLAGGTVIAEDDNTVTPTLGTFETSIVNYSYVPEDANKVGLPLEIRLLAGSKATAYAECNFDDVKLTADPPFPAPEGVSIVDLTLTVQDELNPAVSDSMTIDVYETACMAARFGLSLDPDHPADFDKNCKTGLEDLLEMTNAWLKNTAITEAVTK